MIKSWLLFLLPKDEYKRQKVLYFLAEASIVLLISSIVFLSISFFMNIDSKLTLIFNIYIFITYFLLRYIFSGIEFANITNQKEYIGEIKKMIFKAIMFFIVFSLLYIVFTPNTMSDWVENILVSAIASLLLFFINFISLNRSYRKNINLE